MSIATIGAFAIGEYPEGVAVMLFYAVGEVFQTLAVKRAKANIKTLLDQRPDEVTILENNQAKKIKAENAKIGDIIQLKSGEKLGLDGELFQKVLHSIQQHLQEKANQIPKQRAKQYWQE
jgi:Cd2+/Zn2+-exporting ATPase